MDPNNKTSLFPAGKEARLYIWKDQISYTLCVGA